MTHGCGGRVVYDYRGELRCAGCRHRVPRGGTEPVESRRRPPWTWPGEILARVLTGWLA